MKKWANRVMVMGPEGYNQSMMYELESGDIVNLSIERGMNGEIHLFLKEIDKTVSVDFCTCIHDHPYNCAVHREINE